MYTENSYGCSNAEEPHTRTPVHLSRLNSPMRMRKVSWKFFRKKGCKSEQSRRHIAGLFSDTAPNASISCLSSHPVCDWISEKRGSDRDVHLCLSVTDYAGMVEKRIDCSIGPKNLQCEFKKRNYIANITL